MKPISLTIFSVLIFLGACATPPQKDQPLIAGIPTVSPEEDNSTVVLRLYDNQDLPIGLGFTVFVEGWEPNDQVSIEAISPAEQRIGLLKENATLPVSGEGKVEFSITYKHQRLYKGQWVLLVTGKSGAHAHYFNVP